MPTKSIPIEEAKDRLNELVSLVKSGTEVLLVEREKPVARLVGVEPRAAGLHPGAISIGEGFDAPLPDTFWAGEK